MAQNHWMKLWIPVFPCKVLTDMNRWLTALGMKGSV